MISLRIPPVARPGDPIMFSRCAQSNRLVARLAPVAVQFPPYDAKAWSKGDKTSQARAMSIDKYISKDGRDESVNCAADSFVRKGERFGDPARTINTWAGIAFL